MMRPFEHGAGALCFARSKAFAMRRFEHIAVMLRFECVAMHLTAMLLQGRKRTHPSKCINSAFLANKKCIPAALKILMCFKNATLPHHMRLAVFEMQAFRMKNCEISYL